MKVYRDIVENGVTTQTEIFDIVECTYTGKDMSERSITATILWPSPIDFKVGDYVMLSIQSLKRGVGVEGSILSGEDMERFYLYTMPTIKKTARPMSTGKAFEHNVTFYPRQYELGLVQMRDCGQEVATADTIIYTGFDSFTFVGGADELMRRIMAVLKEAYHDADGNALWDYEIADEVNEYKNTALESISFTFSGNSVMDALLKLNDKEGINTTFFINGRTIYVGYKRPYFCRVTDGSTIDTDTDTQMFKFEYGKTSDKGVAIDYGGLYEITKSVGKESPITKLFAYGANRNLNRYYCSDRIQSGRYVNKLMLPSFDADGKTDYILSQRGIEKYGIREGSKQFEDIYPSLRYMTYGDLRQIQYCIKIVINPYDENNVVGRHTSNDTESTLYQYPITRIQCYKVEPSGKTAGINKLTPCAPPDDLAIMVHAMGKVVKCVLYGGATDSEAIAKQRAHDSVVPTTTYNGSDYIPGSCYVVHDRGFDSDGTTYVFPNRSSWFTNPMDYEGSSSFTDAQKSELRLHQIIYEDTFYLSDVYRFTDYRQTSFSRDGYSAYAWPRTNTDYLGGTPDSTTVNEVVAVEPIVIEDTSSNIDGLGIHQKTFDIYLRDVGFKIDEQNDFGEMVHIVGSTLTISMLDGLLAGREFTANGTVVDNQYSCICAYNDDGSLNDEFFIDSQYNTGTTIPTEALANGAIWRICVNRINLDEADYSNLNLILPTKDLCVKAGDHLVFLDIFMPDIYIHAAENRLLREATKYLAANDNGSITYSTQFDKVRLQQIPTYALQMREGLNIRMVDNDLDIFTRNDSQTLFESKNGLSSSVSLIRSDVDKIDTETTENVYYTVEHRGVEDMLTNYPKNIVYNDIVVFSKQRKVTCKLGIVPSDLYPKNSELYFPDNKITYVRYASGFSSGSDNFRVLETLYYPIESIKDTDNAYVKEITFILDKDPKDMHLSRVQNAKYEVYYFPGLPEYDIRTKHTETSTTTHVTHKNYILPQGSHLFCPVKQLIDFRATSYYTVTMDVENTSLPDFGNLFVLLNNLGENSNYYTPDYKSEEISSEDSSWRRFVFTFQLESYFNDNQSYYPAIRFISDGTTERVSVRLISVVESDSEVMNGEELNYADLKIESVTIKMTNSDANAAPIREITANFADNPLASTWATLMSNTETTKIESEQNIKAIETLVNTARKNYQTLLNLRDSIFDPDGTCDQTFLQVMMLQVGADSMNYHLDNTRTGLGTNGAQVFWNCSCAKESGNWYFKVLPSDTLRHYVYTAGAQAGTWSINNGITQQLDGSSTYFVCLKCSREGNTGEWVCSTKQYAVNDTEDTDYWYFNWGILTVDSAGNYTITETRGNAYMYGDNLVCGKISTIAGNSYFDLNNGDFVLSNGTTKALSYINGVLTVSGVATEKEAENILERLGLAEGNISSTQTAVQTAQSTADAAKTAIDNIEIGGRNLAIFNTATVSNMAKGTNYDFTQTKADTKTVLQLKVDDYGSNPGSAVDYISQDITTIGTYSFAFTLKQDATVFRVKANGAKEDSVSIFNFTETLKAGTNVVVSVTFTNVTQGSFAWKNVQIEKGNKPTDWTPAPEDVEAAMQQIRTDYEEAIATEEQERNTALAKVQTNISNLQSQIDGEVTSWFLKGVPTTTNQPAVGWDTDELKQRHEGDTYTNMSSYEEDPDNAGKSWSWCKGADDDPATTWHWHIIADSDAVKALVEAGNAQSTADSKSTTFVVKPTQYKKGDLWILQSDSDHTAGKKGDILTANADSNSYNASHWSKEVKYTDDTAAQTAQTAANNAKTAADNAKSVADAATTRLDNWANDGVISPTEKQGIKDEIARIAADKTQITNEYTKYSMGTPTDYNTAYTNYNTVLGTLSAATPENITIPSDFSTKQTAYYTARTNALNAISKKADEVANAYTDNAIDNIEIGGENLYYLDNPLVIAASSTDNYNSKVLCSNLENGQTYTFFCEKSERLAGTATSYTVYLYSLQAGIAVKSFVLSIGNTAQSCTFTVPDNSNNHSILVYAGVVGSTVGNSIQWTNIMIQKGDKATSYQKSAWKLLYNQGVSFSYVAEEQALGRELLYGIPTGTYQATISSEDTGDGAKQDVSGAFANSCVVWLKKGGTIDTSSVLAITDWGEKVQLFQAADVYVFTGIKDFIEYYFETGGDAGTPFPAAGTWSIANARIITYETDSIAGSAADANAKAAALDYLKAALTDGSTEIVGGLTMTNVLMLKNLAGNVTAGMSGLTTLSKGKSKTDTSLSGNDNILLWGGGTYNEAFYAALNNYKKSSSGSEITTLLKKDGTGKIGIFKISDTQAIIDVPNQGKVIIDASEDSGGIRIYDKDDKEKITISPDDVDISSLIANTDYTETIGNIGEITLTRSTYVDTNNITHTVFSGTIYTVPASDGSLYVKGLSVYVQEWKDSGAATTNTGYKATMSLYVGNDSVSTQFGRTEDVYYGNGTVTINASSAKEYDISNSVTIRVRIDTTTNNTTISAASIGVSCDACYILKQQPRTVISRNGVCSFIDKDRLFAVINGDNKQDVYFKGLPSSTTGLSKGQLYSDSNGFVKIKTS